MNTRAWIGGALSIILSVFPVTGVVQAQTTSTATGDPVLSAPQNPEPVTVDPVLDPNATTTDTGNSGNGNGNSGNGQPAKGKPGNGTPAMPSADSTPTLSDLLGDDSENPSFITPEDPATQPGTSEPLLQPLSVTSGGGGSTTPLPEHAATSFQVDPYSGSGVLSLPLFTPQGRKGIQPDLTLSYAPGGGNGVFGFGWAINFGAIERSTKHGVPHYDSTDTFVASLGGATQELVHVSGTRYQARSEGAFILFDFDGDTWEAKDKQGNTYYFGLDDVLNDASVDHGQEYQFRWRLSEVKDVFGNYYFIRHLADGRFEIYYTGEPGTDRDALGGRTQNFQVTVDCELDTQARKDIMLSYRSGFEIRKDKRITAVNVRAGGNLVRRYELAYEDSANTSRSLLTQITEYGADGTSSMPPVVLQYQENDETFDEQAINGEQPQMGNNLFSVRYGMKYAGNVNIFTLYPTYQGNTSQGVLVSGDIRNVVDWGPTVLSPTYADVQRSWSHGLYGEFHYGGVTDSAFKAWTYLFVNDPTPLTLSFNADVGSVFFRNDYANPIQPGQGITLQPGYNMLELTGYNQSHGSIFDQNTPIAQNTNIVMSSAQFILPNLSGDFNGDGLVDVATYYPNDPEVKVALSQGDHFAPRESWGGNFTEPGSQMMVGDFNGDGLMDIGSFSPTTAAWRVGLSDGTRFVYDGIWRSPWAFDWQASSGEFNGDGLSDPVLFRADANALYALNGFSTGTNFEPSISGPYVIGPPTATPFLADFNGDGITDFASFDKATGNWEVSYVRKALPGQVQDVAPSQQIATGFGAGKTMTVSDFNGDGLTDIGYFDFTDGRIYYRASLGDGFDTARQLPFTFTADEDYQIQTSDFNGDGLTDYAAYNSFGHLEIKYSRGEVPDLLARIDNGIGGTTQIAYKPVTSYANTFLPMSTPVVDYVTVSTAQGDEYTTSYLYHGGLWDAGEREFFGFGRVRVTDPEGHYAETVFHQDDYYLRGRPVMQAQYDSSNNLFGKTENIWNVQTLNASTSKPVKCVFLARRDNFIYDGNQDGHRTAEEYFYEDAPQWGNLTRAIRWGEVDLATGNAGNDKRTTLITYTNNEQDSVHIIGLPAVTEVRDDFNQVVRHTQFYYDNAASSTTAPVQGLLTKKVDWVSDQPGVEDPVTLYSYDAYGNLRTTTDPRGETTDIAYDTEYHIFPLTTTNALGHQVTNTYYGIAGVPLDSGDGYRGLWGQLKSTTDPNNQTGRRIYDTFGRLVKSVGPLDSAAYPTSEIVYEETSAYRRVLQKARIAHGQSATLDSAEFSDGLGRVIQAKAPHESGQYIVTGQTSYNSRGLPERQYMPFLTPQGLATLTAFDAAQPNTLITYDAMGRPVETRNPDGTYATVIYDDWVTTAIDENGHQQKSYFDAYGRLVRREEFTGADGRGAPYYATQQPFNVYARTFYRYDTEGNLTQTEDEHGNITDIAYDNLGRKISMTDPDMGFWQYAYDANGNLVAQTDAKGQTITFQYDALNRLTRKTDGAGLDVAYTYDDPTVPFSKGRLTKVAYNNGEQTEFIYDELGREVSSVKVIGSKTYTVSRSYDALNRITEITYPDNKTVGYEYNTAGQVERVIENLSLNTSLHPSANLIAVGAAENGERHVREILMSAFRRGVTLARDVLSALNPFSVRDAYAATGEITRDVWQNISGGGMNDLLNDPGYPDSPDLTGTLTTFEGPVDWGYLYGSRLRGYLHPAESGSYTFYIASDDESRLYLSADDNPANKQEIARAPAWTGFRQWTKYASQQQSATITLTAGQVYYIEALHVEGGGGDHVSVGWTTPSNSTITVIDGAFLSTDGNGGGGNPPAAPVLGAPTAGDGQVSLSWSAVSGATSYNVYYRTSGGTYGSPVSAGSNTSYTVTGLTNGTTYDFTATAVNANGESVPSNPLSATPQASTPPPSGSGAFQQDGGANGIVSIEVEHFEQNTAQGVHTWEAATVSGQSGDGVMVALPDNGINETTSYISNSPRLDFEVNFVKTGTHYVWVRAWGPHGGSNSLHVGMGGAAVTTSDNMTLLTDGVLEWTRSTVDGEPVAKINITQAGLQTLNIWMREDGTMIDKIVLTTNSGYVPSGSGPMESPRDDGSSGNPPDAPVLDTPTAGDGQVSLSWNAVSGATSYNVYSRTSGGSYGSPVSAGSNTSYTVTGLTNGTAYDFTVTAVNANGESASSNPVSATPAAASSGSGAFQQDGGADGIVSIEVEHFDQNTAQGSHTWEAATISGQSGDGVMVALPDTQTNENNNFVSNSPRLDYEVNFVKTGIHYVWVRALGPHGGSNSMHVGIGGAAVTTSDNMTLLTDGVLEWTRSTIDGEPVAKINITQAGVQTLNIWMREDGVELDKIVLTTDSGYVPSGTGPAESPRDGGSGGNPPNAPVLGTPTAGDGQVSLSWAAVNGATSYNVYHRTSGGTYGSPVSAGSNTSYTVTGLTNGTTYDFTVTAVNANGESVSSNPVSATPAAAPAGNGTDYTQDPACEGAWMFDGDTADSSSHGRSGTAVNTSTDPSGKFGSAIRFDGGEGYVNVGNFDPSGGDMTMVMWVKWTGDDGGHEGLLSKRNTWSSSGMRWQLFRDHNTDQIGFMQEGSYGEFPVNIPRQNDWVHVAVVHAAGQSDKLYIDGQLASSKAAMTFGSATTAPVVIGNSVPVAPAEGFNGSMDEVAIFSRALDTSEIAEIISDGLTGGAATPPPVSSDYVQSVDYNTFGQIERVAYGNGTVTTYQYNDLNLRLERMVTLDSSGAPVQDLSYTYDNTGNIVHIDDAVNTDTQDFAYDEQSRLVSAGGSYGSKTYAYDEIGNLLSKDGRSYTYGENGAGPHAVTSLSDGSIFGYDLNGNMVTRLENGVSTVYAYDTENRLIDVVRDGTAVASFEYDGDGGRTKKIVYGGSASSGTCFLAGTPILMSDGTTRPIETLKEGDMVISYDETTMDKVPARITETFEHETDEYILLNGTLAATPDHRFYSAGEWRKLNGLTPSDVLMDTGLTDAAIDKLEKIRPKHAVKVYNIEVDDNHNYFAGGYLVHNKLSFEELLGYGGSATEVTYFVGALYEESNARETRHVFFGDKRVSSLTNDEQVFIHDNHLGSANVITDGLGVKKELIEYEPWGGFARHEKYGSGDDVAWHYFTGQRHDTETGLYFYNARYYDPGLGRFISPDTLVPYSDDAQSLNRYTYVRNNPVNLVDPSGNIFGFIVAAIVIAVKAVVSFAIAHPIIFAGVVSSAVNVATNSSQIHNVGDFLKFAGIGYASGAAAAGSGLGAFAGMGGELFGSRLLAQVTSSIIVGGVGGFVNGSGNAIGYGVDFDDAISIGATSAMFSAAISAGTFVATYSLGKAVRYVADGRLSSGGSGAKTPIGAEKNTVGRSQNVEVGKEAGGKQALSNRKVRIKVDLYDGDGNIIASDPNGITYPPNRGFLGDPQKTVLQTGTVIDRYGSNSGSFASPQGTPFSARSLPAGAETRPLATYKVLKPLEVYGGETAPWFGQPGLGTQYDLGASAQDLIEQGFLEVVK